jgi:hypothetical protein
MTSPFRDRVRESATTTGTGSFTLTGTSSGYQTFLGAGFATGDVTYYTIVNGSEWEVGRGTFTAPATLARTTVYASSNSNAAVNFSAGTKTVFCDVPASYLNAFVSSTAVPIYQTKAALEAATVSGTLDSVVTLGYSAAGDRGGITYKRVGSEPSHTAKAQSDDGAWWEAASIENILQFGADPTGTNDVSTAFKNALLATVAVGGGKVIVPRGTYKVSASIQPGTIAGDIIIEFEGAKLVAATGLDDPVLDLRPSASAITDYTCRIINPKIDCSAGTTAVGTDGCTAINAQYYRQLIIKNPDLYGGSNPTNTNSDSGVSAISCAHTRIEGGTIAGFGDAGVYPSGDNTAGATGDGSVTEIVGTYFYRCNVGVTPKRELEYLLVEGCKFEECVAGIVAAEVSPYVAPARKMDIRGNRFKKCKANIARYRGITTGSFSDNIVEDWGYDYTGTTSAGGNAIALLAYGTSNLKCTNNVFELVEWARDQHVAVLLDNVTLDGTPYTQGNHHFEGNTYRGAAYGIYEGSGGTRSDYVGEIFDDVTTPFGGSFHVDSLASYRVITSKRDFSRLNGIVRPITGAIEHKASSVTLTAADSGGVYTNIGATALVVITLPAAAAGLKYTFIVTDSDGIQIKAVSGDYILTNTGASTSGGTATNTSPYSSITLEAVSSDSFVATAMTGTWTLA